MREYRCFVALDQAAGGYGAAVELAQLAVGTACGDAAVINQRSPLH